MSDKPTTCNPGDVWSPDYKTMQEMWVCDRQDHWLPLENPWLIDRKPATCRADDVYFDDSVPGVSTLWVCDKTGNTWIKGLTWERGSDVAAPEEVLEMPEQAPPPREIYKAPAMKKTTPPPPPVNKLTDNVVSGSSTVVSRKVTCPDDKPTDGCDPLTRSVWYGKDHRIWTCATSNTWRPIEPSNCWSWPDGNYVCSSEPTNTEILAAVERANIDNLYVFGMFVILTCFCGFGFITLSRQVDKLVKRYAPND